MIPGLPSDILEGSDEEGSKRMKRMIFITDSMTAAELDSDGSPFMTWAPKPPPTKETAAIKEKEKEKEKKQPSNLPLHNNKDGQPSNLIEVRKENGKFVEPANAIPVGLSWRVLRVAKGSGTNVREVEELLCQYRMMANMAKQAGGKNGWMSAMQKMQQAAGGKPLGANGMPSQSQIAAMQVSVCGLPI